MSKDRTLHIRFEPRFIAMISELEKRTKKRPGPIIRAILDKHSIEGTLFESEMLVWIIGWERKQFEKHDQT